jgi:hypothetical protein
MPYTDKEKSKQYQHEYCETNKERLKEYRRNKYLNNRIKYIEESKLYGKSHKEHKKEYDKLYRETNKEKIKSYNENLKKSAYKIIAEYRNSDVTCWNCGEARWQCLTIAHLNNDGSEDRKYNGRGHTLYRAIINKKRKCDDLQLECYNCNNVNYHYEKYPSELKTENPEAKDNMSHNEQYKKEAYDIICKHHNYKLECWKCGESLIEALTIGHVNQNGAEDVKKYGKGTLYRKIIKGERSVEDLKLECWTCNCTKYYFGRYPDELNNEMEEFKNGQ